MNHGIGVLLHEGVERNGIAFGYVLSTLMIPQTRWRVAVEKHRENRRLTGEMARVWGRQAVGVRWVGYGYTGSEAR
jgi:hypothetical protein